MMHVMHMMLDRVMARMLARRMPVQGVVMDPHMVRPVRFMRVMHRVRMVAHVMPARMSHRSSPAFLIA